MRVATTVMLIVGSLSVAACVAMDRDAVMPDRAEVPATTEAAGELSAAEKLFQGGWQLNSFESGSYTGTLSIDGRDFQADTVHGAYQGYVTIRPDASPAEIDFTVVDCGGCNLEGKTSAGIYYEDTGTIVFVAPVPGEPRPRAFTGLDPERVLLERATRQHPLLPRQLDPATE